jgi:pyruvate formate lyase activating enzyme
MIVSMKKEALLYQKQEHGRVQCLLCNHYCLIEDRDYGFCRVRYNESGTLYSINYSKIIANVSDPIEKKPLYHFLPSTKAYSIASAGCNFRCEFCQNWQISQQIETAKLKVPSKHFSPEMAVSEAKKDNCSSIAYTYTEPTIFFEFAYETAKIAKANDIKNVFVTNGYMSQQALDMITPYLDAANVDLKAFSDSFYKNLCQAHLKPVLKTIEAMKQKGIWLEITTLLIPGENDTEEEMGKIADFIASIDTEIPWHISRFYPAYKNNANPTSKDKLESAYKIGKSRNLKYVYVGNYPTDYGNNTYCPKCEHELIQRYGFYVQENNIENNKCKFCGQQIAGIF